MDKKKRIIKKILHWVFLVAIACVLGLIVLCILMLPVIKGDVFYTKEGRQTRQSKQEGILHFSDKMDHEPPTSILVELRNEDIFEKGYYEYEYTVFSSGVAYIVSENDSESGTEWKVYISDTRLSEEEIYALEETEPVAINKGETRITRGQWIYILCNVNSQTSEAPSASMISIYCIRNYA